MTGHPPHPMTDDGIWGGAQQRVAANEPRTIHTISAALAVEAFLNVRGHQPDLWQEGREGWVGIQWFPLWEE